jgi:hypothetical protein
MESSIIRRAPGTGPAEYSPRWNGIPANSSLALAFSSPTCPWNRSRSSASTISVARRAEQYNKEGKIALKWTRLSCKTMAQNEVRLQLHALAYNLGAFLQVADLPDEIATWSLTSLQTRLIKIGARVVRHARAVTFQPAEVIISSDLFHRILAAIYRLRQSPVPT